MLSDACGANSARQALTKSRLEISGARAARLGMGPDSPPTKVSHISEELRPAPRASAAPEQRSAKTLLIGSEANWKCTYRPRRGSRNIVHRKTQHKRSASQ